MRSSVACNFNPVQPGGSVKRFSVVMFVVLVVLVSSSLASKSKKSDSASVDSGSFGIFVNGKRVATEHFKIDQRDGYSVTTSELKMEDGSKAAQHAELEILANGNLRKYSWNEISPGKAKATVEPSENFLTEHVMPDATQKPLELAFILPPSTVVIDDYFISHREVLLWRYIAGACGQAAPNSQCKLEKSQFGVFIPRQQAPSNVTIEYKGREKIDFKGTQRELDHFDLTAEGLIWSMWVDAGDSYKLVRVAVPTEKTEVVRD